MSENIREDENNLLLAARVPAESAENVKLSTGRDVTIDVEERRVVQ